MALNIQYQLRPSYVGFSGGTIRLDETRVIDISALLAAGFGTITADSRDAVLIGALDAYPALIRSGQTENPPLPIYSTLGLQVRGKGVQTVDLDGAGENFAVATDADGKLTLVRVATKVELDQNTASLASEALARAAGDQGVRDSIPAAVAANSTVISATAAAASAAIDAKLAGAQTILARQTETPIDDPAVVAITDESGRRTFLEALISGGPTANAVRLMFSALKSFFVPSNDRAIESDVAFAITDDQDRPPDLAVDRSGKLVWGTIASIFTRARESARYGRGLFVADGMVEWWSIFCLRTTMRVGYERVVGGCIGGYPGVAGEIFVWESTPRGTKVEQVNIAPSDDHNAPSLVELFDGSLLCINTQHNNDNKWHLSLSDASGSIESMADAPPVVLTMPTDTSYAEPFLNRHQSDATKSVIWALGRMGSAPGFSWRHVTITIDHATRAVTLGTVRTVIAPSPRQCYMIAADSHRPTNQSQELRIAFGYNPEPEDGDSGSDIHAVSRLRLDCATGDLRTLPSGTVVGNVITGAGLPLADDTVERFLPEPQSGWSRRLFYERPGPIKGAVGVCDFPVANPAAGVYRVVDDDGLVREYGAPGKKIGNIGGSYVAGLAFPSPCYGETVAVCREANGLSTLEEHRVTRGAQTARILRRSPKRLARPFYALGGSDLGPMCAEIDYYDQSTYRNWISTLVSGNPWN
jgi:hypothetical protein